MSPTTANCSRRPSGRGAPLALAALLIGVGLATPSTAEASGFLGARFGADHGNPVGDNPFSIYFNPAALGAVEGTQLSLDAAVLYRFATYARGADALSPGAMATQDPNSQAYQDYVRANTGKGKVNNVLALPFAGIATDFGGSKLLHGGFAVYIPFGGLASWDRSTSFSNSLAPGGNYGPQRWFNISGSIISIYSTAALAITIPDTRLSIGINASFAHHTVSTVRARNTNGSDDTGTSDQVLEGRSLIDASGNTLSGAIGIYYEAIPNKLKFGASFTSRPAFGQMRLNGTLRTQFGTTDSTSDIELLQTYPDVWRLGASYRASDKVELRLDGEYVTWSNFRRQCLVNAGSDAKCELYQNGAELPGRNVVIQVIDREWKDAFAVRLGVGYFVTDKTELFGSALFDSSAVPDGYLDPTFIDSNKIHWVLGARQQFSRHFALAGSINHVYFFERDTRNKNVFYERQADSKQPSAGGVYNQQYIYLNLNGTYTF